jgi:hypothetical protein
MILLFISYTFYENSYIYKTKADLVELKDELILASKYSPHEVQHYWGYIDNDGNVLVDFNFHNAEIFENEMGFAVVTTKENELALLTSDFKLVTEINGEKIEQIGYTSEGLKSVKLEGRWGYINKEIELVIDNIYDSAFPFNNGLALIYIENEQKTGVINKLGEYILDPIKEDKVALEFNHLVAGYGYEENKKWGFKDYDGNILLEAIYEYTMAKSDSIIIFCMEGKVGFIDLETGFKLEPIYETADNYNKSVLLPYMAVNNSIAFYEKNKNSDEYIMKLVDNTNNELIAFKTSRADYRLPYIYEELMPVFDGEKWGYINKNGKKLIRSKFLKASRFDESGYALVSYHTNYFYYIDKKGRRVSLDFYDEPEYGSPSKGYIGGRKFDKSYVVLDSNFNIIWESR